MRRRGFDAERFATVVTSEARAVVATMRSNARWSARASNSALNGYGLYGTTDVYDGVEDGLLDAFANLRGAHVRTEATAETTKAGSSDGSRASGSGQVKPSSSSSLAHTGGLSPLEFLEPFLDVIRSVETSGLITAQALSAILKILKSGAVTPDVPGGAGTIMHAVADAVTLCRFEATSVEDDDAVLSQILFVLVECVKCSCGAALSDDDLCDVFQACYRIGHQSGKETPLLRELSKQALSDIVHHVGERLYRLLNAHRMMCRQSRLVLRRLGDPWSSRRPRMTARAPHRPRARLQQDLGRILTRTSTLCRPRSRMDCQHLLRCSDLRRVSSLRTRMVEAQRTPTVCLACDW